MRKIYILSVISLSFYMISCDDDNNDISSNSEKVEINQEEWYSGGKLGTTFNTTSFAYEQPTPAIENAGMAQAFKFGEYLFEKDFNENTDGAFCGLGPVMVRRGCLYCHPNYGHGKRQLEYSANTMGNGYLLVVTDETDTYLSSLTGMPQTLATRPFKAPIDESKIKISWLDYTDEWGNTFADGEKYNLIYPEVSIPEDAYYVPLEVTKNGIVTNVPHENVKVRLESTIGVYGTGLLDAIDDADLKAEYASQEKYGVTLNPAIFANGEWVKTYSNSGKALKYTYALSRGPLQDAAGANAIWNITNVTRSNRRYNYITATYASVSSKDPDVQENFYQYYPESKITGDIETDIYNFLMAKDLPIEMSDEDYKNFMIWHRGLAVPAARDLDNALVQRGKKLFTEMGCATCHKPSWTTGEDKICDPSGFFAEGDNSLPRYPNQKIWPYTDMIQHRLFMENDIRTGWCRTTPLWGRGLSEMVTGASDRLHDCRARTVIEAIMWHGSASSDARFSIDNFRKLSKDERDAVVSFIESI